jgi:hypothetical protein
MRHTILTVASSSVLLLLATTSSAQLTDIQPGRNFTDLNSAQFGTGRSENIDVGDVDNDGDLDVIVANGGDGTNQANRIYINQGGLQGGTVGTFSDGTASRFSGIPADRSRDIEFVDIDADGDLDIYVGNRGSTAEGGQVSRFYLNQGGFQAGTIGFYAEDTNNRWGALASVPLSQQVFGGNAGPWRDFSCDCDFADLDDDGDIDLFHSSYGPGFNGLGPSRVFLNDGTGVFDELFPWVNAGADIAAHSLDMDIMDFDADFDLDVVMSSRNSQARVFMNNSVNGIGGTLFDDITQHALIDNGAVLSGGANYECEPADVDGDGDFDVWMKNYNGVTDRLLRNNGFTAGQGFEFVQMNPWIKGDPTVDENEVDFLDYDSDGDLDTFVANFSGTNYLYQSGLAQGIDPIGVGLYHRNGTTTGGGIASWSELPVNSNGGTSLDGETGDMDNDGDQDILIANDGNQQNRYFENRFGVPDTHAPTFLNLTVQGDKAGGTDTVIHALINDNSAFYLTAYYDADLIYTVDGGGANTVDMFSMGGQMFRGVIPDTNGVIAYHVEVTDRAGNTGVSGATIFTQGPPPPSAWTDIGFGHAGVSGIPTLVGTGTMVVGSPNAINLSNAAAGAVSVLFISTASTPSPFKGGTLATVPVFLTFTVTTSGSGTYAIPVPSWPAGLPSGFEIFLQYGIADGAASAGTALSNAIKGVQP